MKEVYLIVGSIGEYSDYRIWEVGIVDNKNDAQNFIDFMNKKLDASERLDWDDRKELAKFLEQFDSNIQIDYTGTDYSYHKFQINEIPGIFKLKKYQTKLGKVLRGEDGN